MLLALMLWLAFGCAVPSILPEAVAFTTALSSETRASTQDLFPKTAATTVIAPRATQRTPLLLLLQALPMPSLSDNIDNAVSATPVVVASVSQLQQQPQIPPLDAIGVDPGQALFWSTLVHWGLWAKAPQYVALSFDALCIGITLWDGTVRAAL